MNEQKITCIVWWTKTTIYRTEYVSGCADWALPRISILFNYHSEARLLAQDMLQWTTQYFHKLDSYF